MSKFLSESTFSFPEAVRIGNKKQKMQLISRKLESQVGILNLNLVLESLRVANLQLGYLNSVVLTSIHSVRCLIDSKMLKSYPDLVIHSCWLIYSCICAEY